MTKATTPAEKFALPIHILRSKDTQTAQRETLRRSQKVSDNHRQTPVTLRPVPWAREEGK
jgi:hypothetical protein